MANTPANAQWVTPFPSETADALPHDRQITQEFRLASNPQDQLSWQVGTYYFNEDIAIVNYDYNTLDNHALDGFAAQSQTTKAWALLVGCSATCFTTNHAEINRLKQIMDLTAGPAPVLFLLDELLSGTNSHDRLIGTRSFVTRLVERGAVGLVSTHDLALTAIPEEIGSKAINCHFEDHLKDGRLHFDYKLYPGIVQTSNALPLMRSIGLEV